MKTRILSLMFLVLALGLGVSGLFGPARADAQVYTTTSTSSSSAGCLNFAYDMGVGYSGGNVVALQTFLNSWGYMSYASTGYYGSITSGAVMRFQAANGISNTGYVGPLTRARILAISCGNVPNQGGVSIYGISPSAAPVGAVVTITGFGFTPTNNIVHLANGAIGNLSASGGIAVSCTTDPSCIPGIRQTISFTIPSYIGPYCQPNVPCPMYASQITVPGSYPLYVTNDNGTSNSLTLTVTNGTTTGGISVSSVSPTSGPVGTSVTITGTGFTNDNTIYFANGAIQHVAANTIYNYSSGIVCNGYPNCTAPLQSITFTVPSSVGPYCAPGMLCAQYMQLVTPGTYNLSVGNDTYGKSNVTAFTVTGASNSSLSISGIDSPNQLTMTVPGTWTVHTTSMQQGTLHYSVVWGDEYTYPTSGSSAMASPSIQSSATFSHAYQRAGTYNPTFTVSDDYGHSVTSSTSIYVMPIY